MTVSQATTPNTILRHAMRRKNAATGWIGVDLGTYAIKLAQLVRTDGVCHILQSWELPRPGLRAGGDDPGASVHPLAGLDALRSLRRLFSGRQCAAVLPMSQVEFRLFEVPRAEPREQREMVAEFLAGELRQERDEFTFDYWTIENGAALDGPLSQVAAMALPSSHAAELAQRLLKSGWECQALDGMPCAVARAVELAAGSSEASLALDLGFRSPLAVLIEQGRPVFSRQLRGGGLGGMMRGLQAELQITLEECQQLLNRVGLAVPGQASSPLAERTSQLVARPLHQLVSEVQRTIEFLHQQYRQTRPQRLWLLGGGALVRNLPEYFTQALSLPVSAWELDSGVAERDAPAAGPERRSAALFGVAAALSSLAWEG